MTVIAVGLGKRIERIAELEEEFGVALGDLVLVSIRLRNVSIRSCGRLRVDARGGATS